MSLDFIRGEEGLYLLECNPRATSAVHLIEPGRLIGGITDASQATWVEGAGRCRQLAFVLLASAPVLRGHQPPQAHRPGRGDDR
jgi:hypothetical protein